MFGERGLRASHLTNDDAVGPETQRVPDELAQTYLPYPLAVGRTTFEPDHVAAQLQLGCVFHRHHPLGGRNLANEDVEQRRLPRAGTPGHEEVGPPCYLGSQEVGPFDGNAAHLHQLIQVLYRSGETTHGDYRAVDRDRWQRRVETRPVGQPGVDRRAGRVQPQPERCDDPLNRGSDGCRAGEADVGQFEHTMALDPNLPPSVDQDIAHRRVAKQLFERTQPYNLIDGAPDRVLAAERSLVAEKRGALPHEALSIESYIRIE